MQTRRHNRRKKDSLDWINRRWARGPSRPETATIVRVIDGDTVVTETGERIRLSGINPPEMSEPGGERAKSRLEESVLNREVSLESDAENKDVYGKPLRYVICDGENINLKLAEEEQPYWGDHEYLKGSTLSNIFDILSTGAYAFGGILARFGELKAENVRRQEKGERLPASTVLKQTADVLTGGIASGIKHRIDPSAVLKTEGFWAGLATDIAFDPVTYTPAGLATIPRRIGSRLFPKTAKKAAEAAAVRKVAEDVAKAKVKREADAIAAPVDTGAALDNVRKKLVREAIQAKHPDEVVEAVAKSVPPITKKAIPAADEIHKKYANMERWELDAFRDTIIGSAEYIRDTPNIPEDELTKLVDGLYSACQTCPDVVRRLDPIQAATLEDAIAKGRSRTAAKNVVRTAYETSSEAVGFYRQALVSYNAGTSDAIDSTQVALMLEMGRKAPEEFFDIMSGHAMVSIKNELIPKLLASPDPEKRVLGRLFGTTGDFYYGHLGQHGPDTANRFARGIFREELEDLAKIPKHTDDEVSARYAEYLEEMADFDDIPSSKTPIDVSARLIDDAEAATKPVALLPEETTGFAVKEIPKAVEALPKVGPPTKAETAAEELRKIYDDIHAEKVELGIIKGDHYNLQFMHHALTGEGREYIMEKHGGDIGQFIRDQGVVYSRTIKESVPDINKMMLEEHGIKEFFVENPYLASQIYASKHTAAVSHLRKPHPEIIDRNTARMVRISELSRTTTEAETKDVAAILEEGILYRAEAEAAAEAIPKVAAKAAAPKVATEITAARLEAEAAAIAEETAAVRKAAEDAANVAKETRVAEAEAVAKAAAKLEVEATVRLETEAAAHIAAEPVTKVPAKVPAHVAEARREVRREAEEITTKWKAEAADEVTPKVATKAAAPKVAAETTAEATARLEAETAAIAAEAAAKKWAANVAKARADRLKASVVKAKVIETLSEHPEISIPALATALAVTGEAYEEAPTPTVARVINVADGDTVDIVEGGHLRRIRLLGVNTPERGKPGYEDAKRRLEKLVLGKEVSLESDVEDKGKYGRSLRYLFVDGENINLKLVKEGFGKAYLSPENVKYRTELIAAAGGAYDVVDTRPAWKRFISDPTSEADAWAARSRAGAHPRKQYDPIMDPFDAARHRKPQPSEDEKYRAWVAAGEPEGFRIKTLQTEPRMELLALTEEEYEAAQGFEPTEGQLEFLRIPGTMPGSREARYNKMVAEWNEFKAGELKLEQPTQEQRMESWERAGEPKPYKQKVYRDDEGKLLGVSTFTPDEMEDMKGFALSEAQKQWMFRDTAKMLPKEQAKLWKQEYEAEQEQESLLKEELAGIEFGVPIRRDPNAPFVPVGLEISSRRRRRKELEDMLGMGVDR